MERKIVLRGRFTRGMIFSLLILITMVFYHSNVSAEEGPKSVTIGASTIKGSLYPIATAWAQQLQKHLNVTATPLAVGGSSAIAALIGKGKLQLGPCGSETIHDAYFGTDSFAKMGKQPIRAIMNGHDRIFQLYVRADSPFKSPKDIRGKKFMYFQAGGPANNNWGRLLTEAYGIKENEYTRLDYKSTGAGAEAVKEGRADFGFSGAAPNAALMELSRTVGIRFIPISKEAQDHIVKNYAPFQPGVLPKDIYGKGIPPEDVLAIKVKIWLICRADLPEEFVYDATRVVLDFPDEFNKYHKLCKQYTDLNEATANPLIPFHAGAVKYYKKKGVWSDQLEKTQEALLKKGGK
jgi:TRAP transporter TAXI family solute receptor